MKTYKINKIRPQENEFLNRLTDIDNSPKSLWHLGNIPANRPSVAIVGSRKPTSYGKMVNKQLVGELARHGVIIVSGLAIGHDGLAHRACLDAGGTTVAVLGGGLNNIYPKSNANLAEDIIEQGGALISEYHPDARIFPHQFLERNRLISGLADVVVVIEAGEKSGTLNTASHALTQGRDIMAVPGNINSPLSRGCNKLIAQGATPILDVSDILYRLGIDPNQEPARDEIRFDSPVAQTVYDLIKSGVVDGDQIIEQADLSATDFTMAVTMLELNGYISAMGGNRWMLTWAQYTGIISKLINHSWLRAVHIDHYLVVNRTFYFYLEVICNLLLVNHFIAGMIPINRVSWSRFDMCALAQLMSAGLIREASITPSHQQSKKSYVISCTEIPHQKLAP